MVGNSPPPALPKGKFGGLIAVVGAASAAILVPLVQSWEGRENRAYQDIVKVWTICDGDTANVKPGQVATDGECDARLERQLIAHAKPVLKCVPALQNKPNTLAASASLAYNVGTGGWIGIEAERKLKPDAALDGWRGGFCGSTAAVRFRAEQWREGCDAFMLWNRAGSRTFRGLTRRREAERAICLRGLA